MSFFFLLLPKFFSVPDCLTAYLSYGFMAATDLSWLT